MGRKRKPGQRETNATNLKAAANNLFARGATKAEVMEMFHASWKSMRQGDYGLTWSDVEDIITPSSDPIVKVRLSCLKDPEALYGTLKFFRMYMMFAERNGWGFVPLDARSTDSHYLLEFQVQGVGVSRMLDESGHHRYVRRSMFEPHNRLTTYTAVGVAESPNYYPTVRNLTVRSYVTAPYQIVKNIIGLGTETDDISGVFDGDLWGLR